MRSEVTFADIHINIHIHLSKLVSDTIYVEISLNGLSNLTLQP